MRLTHCYWGILTLPLSLCNSNILDRAKNIPRAFPPARHISLFKNNALVSEHRKSRGAYGISSQSWAVISLVTLATRGGLVTEAVNLQVEFWKHALFIKSPKGREAPRFLLATTSSGTLECFLKGFSLTHFPHPLLPHL